MAKGESLRAGKGRLALSYKFRASVESWKAQFDKGHSGKAYGTNAWVICSKEVILSGPEGLEGQKTREAQHEFSTPRMRMLRERYTHFTARVNHRVRGLNADVEFY
jgi:hypothetical protein